MRFFLYGYYGQGNLGDDLLLRACVLGIRGIRPDARFVVRAGRAPTGLETLSIPYEIAQIDEVLSDQTRSRISRLLAVLVTYRGYLRDCDWFVFGGGTLFHERTSAQPIIMLALICLMARAMGVRIAALGVGVAELKSPAALAALRGIVFLSDIFAVRDAAALKQCRKAGASRRVTVTCDLAFALDGADKVRASRRSGVAGGVVGISVYPPALEGSETARHTFGALRGAVSQLVGLGCTVRLLAFHDDEVALMRLADDLADARPSVERLADTPSLAAVFAELDLMCGMRFHGLVLAAVHGVPFVGIAADNKIEAVCQLFDMPVLPAVGLRASATVEAVAASLFRSPDRGVTDRCVAEANRNFLLLSDAVGPRGA